MNHRGTVRIVSLIILPSLVLGGSLLLSSADAAPLKALIVTGQSDHDWRLSTPTVKQILQQTNLFHVDVAISPLFLALQLGKEQ